MEFRSAFRSKMEEWLKQPLAAKEIPKRSMPEQICAIDLKTLLIEENSEKEAQHAFNMTVQRALLYHCGEEWKPIRDVITSAATTILEQLVRSDHISPDGWPVALRKMGSDLIHDISNNAESLICDYSRSSLQYELSPLSKTEVNSGETETEFTFNAKLTCVDGNRVRDWCKTGRRYLIKSDGSVARTSTDEQVWYPEDDL